MAEIRWDSRFAQVRLEGDLRVYSQPQALRLLGRVEHRIGCSLEIDLPISHPKAQTGRGRVNLPSIAYKLRRPVGRIARFLDDRRGL